MPSEAPAPVDTRLESVSATQPLLLSTEAARQLLSCGKTTLFALIRAQQIESVQLGSRRMIVAASVAELVNRARQTDGMIHVPRP